jgi:hypothetical protein
MRLTQVIITAVLAAAPSIIIMATIMIITNIIKIEDIQPNKVIKQPRKHIPLNEADKWHLHHKVTPLNEAEKLLLHRSKVIQPNKADKCLQTKVIRQTKASQRIKVIQLNKGHQQRVVTQQNKVRKVVILQAKVRQQFRMRVIQRVPGLRRIKM